MSEVSNENMDLILAQLKNYITEEISNFRPKTSQFQTGSVTIKSGTKLNITCGFEPRFIKIYYMVDSKPTVLGLYEDGNIVFGAFSDIKTTSTGFSATMINMGTSTTFSGYWEAWR